MQPSCLDESIKWTYQSASLRGCQMSPGRPRLRYRGSLEFWYQSRHLKRSASPNGRGTAVKPQGTLMIEKRPLGKTGIDVTSICLGTMTWGEQNTEAEAHEQLSYACGERGINFIDTGELIPCHRRRIPKGGRNNTSEPG